MLAVTCPEATAPSSPLTLEVEAFASAFVPLASAVAPLASLPEITVIESDAGCAGGKLFVEEGTARRLQV